MKLAKAIALAIAIPAVFMAATAGLRWGALDMPLSANVTDWVRGYGLFFVQSGWLGVVYLLS